MKKFILSTIITISLIYVLGMITFAAPQTLSPEYKGTASDIINVTNPDNGVTTFKNHTVVSVTGDEGVIVTLYTYDPQTTQFVLHTDKNGENSWFVGPSGLFIKRLPINDGINYVGIFAELNGYDQFITRRVDKEDLSIKDGIKAIVIKSMDDIVESMGE
jgi:hypothetical protein